MQSNRDSSVLRSLAVAFGDGLAFGVGMKLTRTAMQRAGEPALEAPPAMDMAPLQERLDEIEKRVGKMERAPAAAAAAAPAPFDKKVLEAVVNALDARLLEQAGQVERRITELEAKLAIELQSLQQLEHSVERSVQTHLEEVNGQFNDQLAAIRRRSDEERAAMQRELFSLHREFAEEAAQAVEDRVAQLRTEIASRDSQIAELRARLEAGDDGLRNVVTAIAQACQTAVTRTGPAARAEPEPVPGPSAEAPLPHFAQPKPADPIMPIALISSLALVSAAGLAMLHYYL